MKAGAVYSFEPGSPPSYITNIEIGITDVDVNLILKRGNIFKTLCLLGTFSFFLLSADFFSKLYFLEKLL